ncbi:S-adenosylmethionine-dependent methyltransferase [Coccidioides posadasii str. Silveira]|uniref:S-adenosylmethionine-dependent methyltransferase n=1 Tax=Coccidioides posadasii (strain RMSCC 757 / Silveira) TaxID=443226 RepID=E9CRT0_COCPS|nr:S-adenosylmethionine-dependent methyltransferase [Coccidioides posadasii str. Silveira]
MHGILGHSIGPLLHNAILSWSDHIGIFGRVPLLDKRPSPPGLSYRTRWELAPKWFSISSGPWQPLFFARLNEFQGRNAHNTCPTHTKSFSPTYSCVADPKILKLSSFGPVEL